MCYSHQCMNSQLRAQHVDVQSQVWFYSTIQAPQPVQNDLNINLEAAMEGGRSTKRKLESCPWDTTTNGEKILWQILPRSNHCRCWGLTWLCSRSCCGCCWCWFCCYCSTVVRMMLSMMLPLNFRQVVVVVVLVKMNLGGGVVGAYLNLC